MIKKYVAAPTVCVKIGKIGPGGLVGWGALSKVVVKNEELKRFQHTVACPRQAESLPRVAASVFVWSLYSYEQLCKSRWDALGSFLSRKAQHTVPICPVF